MNGFERYMSVVRGGEADILPRLPLLMGYAAEFIGRDYAAFASDHRVLVEANLVCARDFGFDQVSAISDPYRETTGFGATVEYMPSSPPRCLHPPLADTKDLAVLERPDPLASPRMLDRVQAVESYGKQVRGEYSILGWVEGPAAEAADLRGVSTFMLDLADDPPFCRELMHLCVDAGIEFARAQLEAGADTIGVGDAVVSQISARMYREIVFDEEKRLVDAIHALGGLVRLHICGNIKHQLPQIALLGVDVCDIDWMVDMARARVCLGPTPLITNLDPVKAVLYATPDTIRQDVRDVYERVGNPCMVGAGCEIPIGTPVANLKALCEPVAWEAGEARALNG